MLLSCLCNLLGTVIFLELTRSYFNTMYMRAREDPRKCIRWEREECEEERKEGRKGGRVG